VGNRRSPTKPERPQGTPDARLSPLTRPTPTQAPACTSYEGLFETVNAYSTKVWGTGSTVAAQQKQAQTGRLLFQKGVQEFERQVAAASEGSLFTDADFPAEAVSLCHDWVHAKVRCVPPVPTGVLPAAC
jgi:hypothetical protein